MKANKILVVDDNQVILTTLSMKLKSAGYEVVTAMDGPEAVGAAQKEEPDLILLDINFPPGFETTVDWDGFKIIQWLHRLERQGNTPIIVISGGETPKFKQQALDAGAVAYFQKPIDNDELLATIKKTLAT